MQHSEINAGAVINKVLRSSLPDGEVTATEFFQVPLFASYRPGELLKKCAEVPDDIVPPEHDNVSECSTADTQTSSTDTPCPLEHKASDAKVVMLQDLIQPEPLPSVGSVGHSRGLCRPCGFVHHKDGCQMGSSCNFCHLCPRGAIEYQRKMKRRLNRAARNL